MAQADDDRAAHLAELVRELLLWLRDNEPPGLPGLKGAPPSRFDVFAGVYRKLAGGLFGSGKISDFGGDPEEARRLRALNLGASHVLLLGNPSNETWDGVTFHVENELYLAGGDLERPGAIRVHDPVLDSLAANRDTLATNLHFTFAGLIDRADLVWDDAAEAKRLGFRYQWIFDYEPRRLPYEMNLRDIIPDAEAGSLEEFRHYLYWFATYENRDRAAEEGGDYYRKWLAPTPLNSKDRIYKPTKLSNDYLRECWHEYVLKRDEDYVMFKADGSAHVFRLGRRPVKGHPWRTELTVDPVLRFHDSTTGLASSASLPGRLPVYVFHAFDGARTLPAQMKSRGKADLSGLWNGRFAFDYKASVRWFLGIRERDAGNDEDWFDTFIDALFPDAIYPVDASWAHAEASTFSIDELLSLAPEMTDRFKTQLAEVIELGRNNPNVRFVIQGWMYGNTQQSRRQLIGVSGSGQMIYEWYPATGLVTQMSLKDWYHDNALGKLFTNIHDATKGMIPFIAAVTFGGVAVAGGAIIGGAALAMLARGAIRNLIQEQATKRLTKAMIRKFRSQLIALVADGILGLLPKTNSLAFELLRGFVHGFGAGAVEHYLSEVDDRAIKQGTKLFNAALSKATAGVSRVYQLYTKISAAYQKLRGVFHALHKVWTDDRARLAAKYLNLLGKNAGLAFLVIVFVVLYVDYVYRKGKLSQLQRDTWVKHQRDAFQFMIRETGADLAAYAHALKEDLHPSKSPSPDAIRAENDKLAAKIASTVIKAPAEAPGTTVLIGELLAELGITNWKELMNLGLFELLARGFDAMLANHPGLTPRGANMLGEALGELVGTIFLERAILPAKWRKNARDATELETAMRKTLAGGTLQALWKFARTPIERLGEGLAALKDGRQPLASSNHDLFERAQRKDTAYRDMLDDLLSEERELGAMTGKLAEDETLQVRLHEMTTRAQSEAPPDIEVLLAGEDPLWPKDAVAFALGTWLRIGLLQLLEAFRLLEDADAFGGDFRLATLLEIAGLSVSLDDDTVQALRVKFERG
jgi:hypothetical protein